MSAINRGHVNLISRLVQKKNTHKTVEMLSDAREGIVMGQGGLGVEKRELESASQLFRSFVSSLPCRSARHNLARNVTVLCKKSSSLSY